MIHFACAVKAIVRQRCDITTGCSVSFCDSMHSLFVFFIGLSEKVLHVKPQIIFNQQQVIIDLGYVLYPLKYCKLIY